MRFDRAGVPAAQIRDSVRRTPLRRTQRWREPDSNRRSPVGVLNNKSGDKAVHLGVDHRARRSDNPGTAHPVRDPVHQCRDGIEVNRWLV